MLLTVNSTDSAFSIIRSCITATTSMYKSSPRAMFYYRIRSSTPGGELNQFLFLSCIAVSLVEYPW